MQKSIAYNILEKNTTDEFKLGNIIKLDVNRIIIHDGSGPVVAETLKEYDVVNLKATDKTVLIFDHYFPAKTSREAYLQKVASEFAQEYNILTYKGKGISHHMVVEMNLLKPGTVLVGGDSHTCTGGALGVYSSGYGATDISAVITTGKLWLEVPECIRVKIVGKPKDNFNAYDVSLKMVSLIGASGALGKVIEFFGDGIKYLNMYQRMRISNFAVETGGLAGIFDIDEVCDDWCKSHNIDYDRSLLNYGKSIDEYDYLIDLSTIEKLIAKPSSPDLCVSANNIESVKVDQVFIGSCSGGFLEDIRTASNILDGKKIADSLRLLICPATEKILEKSIELGYIQKLIKAGATILNPGCGSCLGNIGALADGEVEVSTQNRNFIGRVGSKKAKIYLASSEVASVTALTGFIGVNIKNEVEYTW